MSQQKYKQAVEKIADFWSKQLRRPMNQDNGNAMQFILMNKASSFAQESITDDQLLKFEIELTELLMKELNMFRASLSVDYHPCDKLAQAAIVAQIPLAAFPCKSGSYITEDFEAKAYCGYRKPTVTL